MKVALSVQFNNSGAVISPFFGKSNCFFIYDPYTQILNEKITNHINFSSTADVFCAQQLIGRGVNAVVCGKCEDDAKNLFREAGIKVIEGAKNNPSDFLDQYRSELIEAKQIA